ncbi:MFS transporter [Streptomyces sp. NPDC051183]|uniref:MFS transporter n=1 Tax=unclassified Streptomyces TaxID=2593676 RepID=UPI0034465462
MGIAEQRGASSTAAGATAPAGVGALVVLATAQLLIALDYSVVYVALPSIDEELRFGSAALPWVVSAYAVPFAGFLLVCGRMADLFGARRMLIGALWVIAVSSLGAGLADSAAQLLVARGVQGLGAAALAPSTLALLTSTFPLGRARTRALAVWSTTGASGLTVGVLGGGVVTDAASWRWAFWSAVPLALSAVLLTHFVFRAERTATPVRGPVGWAGAVLVTLGVLFLATGMTRASEGGWLSAAFLVPLLLAVACIGLLVHRERRAVVRLIPPALLHNRRFSTATLLAALFMASFGAEFYLLTLVLQEDKGYTPLAAGLAFIPLAAAAPVGSAVTGRLMGSLGERLTFAIGFGGGGAGLLVLMAASADIPYAWAILPGLLVSGIGQGIAYTATFALGTASIPEQQQGVGSGLITMVQYFGGSVGLAILVIVLRSSSPDQQFVKGFLLLGCVAAFAVAAVYALLSRTGIPNGPPKGDPRGR